MAQEVPLKDYLFSKAVEYESTIVFLREEILKFREDFPERIQLIDRLLKMISDVREQHRILGLLLRSSNNVLIRRGLSIIHDIEYALIILGFFYLPALQREQEADSAIRPLLHLIAKRLGLDYVADVVVRCDGAYATVPNLTEYPLFILPPLRAFPPVGLAAMYHEFGHVVFQRYTDIYKKLKQHVLDYIEHQSRLIGPINPDQRRARESLLSKVAEYWARSESRLNELFSDVFAVYTIGPAYLRLAIDFSIKSRSNPFSVNLQDEHPPWGARVYVSNGALLDDHRSSSLVKLTMADWNDYSQGLMSDPDYDVVCAHSLLNTIKDASIGILSNLLPSIQRYCQSLDEDRSDPLEHFINKGVERLRVNASTYKAWEHEFWEKLQDYAQS